jgi:peptidyl-prolyl cis-trans isomerase B (cyclophilin B)
VLLTGCGSHSGDLPTASIPSAISASNGDTRGNLVVEPVSLQPAGQAFLSPAIPPEDRHPEVEIKTSLGLIRLRLNAEKAPRTVDNFLYNYVQDGYYDQTVIHYVEQGYLVAAGGYDTRFEEKRTHTPIPCEAKNGLQNRRGTIAMARHPDFAHSATSQFFINLADNDMLDCQPAADESINGYCVFGEVIEGLDVLDKIAAVPVHDREGFPRTPIEPVVIESILRVK